MVFHLWTKVKGVAEASGSRTHPRHRVPHDGFEARAQHRPRLASSPILAEQAETLICTAPSVLRFFWSVSAKQVRLSIFDPTLKNLGVGSSSAGVMVFARKGVGP